MCFWEHKYLNGGDLEGCIFIIIYMCVCMYVDKTKILQNIWVVSASSLKECIHIRNRLLLYLVTNIFALIVPGLLESMHSLIRDIWYLLFETGR